MENREIDIRNFFKDASSKFIESANALHEIYSAYVNAGFTEEQAMQLIVAQITCNARQENK